MTLTPDDVREVTFPTAPRGKSGYDEGEVDDFLDRVEEALRGNATLTADEAATIRFKQVRKRGRGYETRAVDTFRERIVVTLRKRAAAKDSRHRQVVERLARQVVQHVAQRQAQQAVSEPPAPRVPEVAGVPEVAEVPDVAEVAAVPNPAGLQSPLAGQPAYDANQVDAFLARVSATLRGADTLTSQDVLTMQFPPQQPGDRGYHEASVDAFMVQVAASLRQLSRSGRARPAVWPRMSAGCQPPLPAGTGVTLTAADVQNVAFGSPHAGEKGYEPDEVDAFLDLVEATLSGNAALAAAEVREVRFTELPAGEDGYAPREVDAFLDLVEEQLTAMGLVYETVSTAADTWPRFPLPVPQLDA